MDAKHRYLRRMAFFAGITASWGLAGVALADKPSASDALKLSPVQAEAAYDRPDREEAEKCTVDVETVGGVSGWVVRSDSGQTLRRFLDTNGDNKVDQWCYYKDGIEVYRDIDADFNGKADQYRWLGTAGIRWGIDKNEDTRIDRWKQISAEEVTAEVVGALRDADAARFEALLLTEDELADLGLSETQTKELQAKLEAAREGFDELARKQTVVTKRSQWINFGASQPGVVAAGTAGSKKDLVVYDNVAAVVETDKKHSQLVVGTLIQAGDVWRLFDLPRASSDTATTSIGYFLQAPLASRPGMAGGGEPAGVSPEVQKLIVDLERVDKSLMEATGAKQQAALNGERAEILTQLIRKSSTADDRSIWIRQFAETVSAATQSGAFPGGVDQLAELVEYVEKLPESGELLPFVKFRQMTAEYNTSLQNPEADFERINTQWMESLEQFVKTYDSSPDAAEAMLQLAIGYEFTGKDDEAVQWFGRIVRDYPSTQMAKKATGAKRRLESVGKAIPLAGKTLDGRPVDLAQLQGQVVLIHYWATWCEPCKQDLQLIKELRARYGTRGFVPIGVNLDNEAGDAAAYLKAKPLSWPQLHEAGGLESRLANEMGILTLPTMILIDSKGKVANRNIHASELDVEIRRLLPKTDSASGRSTGPTKR